MENIGNDHKAKKGDCRTNSPQLNRKYVMYCTENMHAINRHAVYILYCGGINGRPFCDVH